MRFGRFFVGSTVVLALLSGCSSSDDSSSSGGGFVAGGGSGGSGGKAGSSGQAGKGGSAGSSGNQGGSSGASGGSQGGASGASAGGSSGASAGGGAGKAGSGQGGASGASGGSACGASQLDCDGSAANGCETNASSDPKNCGGCGKTCQGADNADPACNAGSCSLSCKAGFAACDGDLKNGCETNTNTDLKNCGYCGVSCTEGPNGKAACLQGKCGFTCQAGFLDCNQNPVDGCEAQLDSDPNNCGSCGKTCGAAKCIQGACECAGTSAAAEPVQLAMYVMLDKSGSMLDQAGGGMTRWQTVTFALNQFFASLDAASIRVGLGYFPLSAPGGTACEQSYYYTPAVPMATLPGPANSQVDALSASMSGVTPSGGTPTQVALGAALAYGADWKKTFPKDKVVVVLATDGQPADACEATLDNSAAAAAAGLSGDPSIPTYVIGVGPLVSNLDTIATNGGTGKAFLVNDGNTSAFIEALKQIKQQAVSCEYAIPKPQGNAQIDYAKVNFQYSPGGGQPQIIGNTTGAGACDPQKGGWYYDDALNPTKILLCPSSCQSIQADPSAKIDIILGCDTKKE